MKKLLTLMFTAGAIAVAQSPSGLLTGPVSYVSSLTAGNPYGNNTVWTKADGSTCSASGQGPNGTTIPQCYIVKYVVGVEYGNLVASDGTGNCYAWDVQQLTTDGRGFPDVPPCQNSFVGNGSGEYGALYCSSTASSDLNGLYNLNCQATWNGTSVVDPNTVYTINVNIRHHAVVVMIQTRYGPRPQTWQQVDSMTVGVTPQPGS